MQRMEAAISSQASLGGVASIIPRLRRDRPPLVQAEDRAVLEIMRFAVATTCWLHMRSGVS